MGLEFWRVGQLRPGTIAADAIQLERQGWDGILMGDSQCMAGDCYVALTVAAQATSTLRLGVGVTNPLTRLPSVTASAAAGVHELSGGRMVLGLGRGDSALANVGLAPSALDTFERYLRHVQTYLRGEGVALDDLERYGHRPIGDLGAAGVPDDSRLHWLNPANDTVPVDVVASGPSVIAIAARNADRITFSVGADPARLSWATDTARQARIDAGLDPDTLQLGAYLNVVAHPDRAVALELAGTGVAMFSRFSVMHGTTAGPLDDRAKTTLDKVARSYDLRQHASGDADHAAAVDADYITSFGVVGTPEHCVERLVELDGLGLDRVAVLGGFAGSRPGAAEQMQRSRAVLTEQVLPAVRAKLG